MATSRSYPTGVTRTVTAKGTIKLYHCGGSLIKASGGYPYGWKGSNFFHFFSDPGPIDNQGVSVEIGAFGASAKILTRLWDARTDGSGDNYVWRTEIYNCGHLVQRWDEVFVEGTPAITPETVTVDWQVTFDAEEWLFETDSESGGTNAPEGARDPSFYYSLKPTGSVNSVAFGDTRAVTPFGADGWTDKTQVIFFVSGQANTIFYPGDIDLSTLPDAGGEGDYSSFTDPYAHVSGLDLGGTVARWDSSLVDPATSATPCATFDGLSWAVNRTYPNLTAHDFIGAAQPPQSESIGATLDNELTIAGTVRDWNGSVTGIPIRFTVPGPCGIDGAVNYDFTGTHTIDGQPDGYMLPPAGYQSDDNRAHLFRLGNEWNALSIDRAASLEVEDFSSVGGSNGWNETDAGTPIYASGTLSVTGTGPSPRIDKTLKSDFLDLWNDIDGWWAANGASLTALSGAEQTAVTAWWAATGDPDSSPHRGEWFRVGRKLLSDSDIFNWSAWRYLDLVGHADVACDITLRIVYSQITFSGHDNDFFTADPGTPEIRTFTVSLSASSATHRLDLASLCGHDGLRYITSLRIGFPNGRTIHLSSLTLEEAARPTVDVHLPSSDLGYISALSDGKHSLFLTPRSDTPPGSRWGWPVFSYDYAAGAYVSQSMNVLAAEIGLQEGWSATVAGSPDHSGPNYAVWLKEAFEAACPVTLKGRRSFGSGAVYPQFRQTIDLEANLGNAIPVLAFNVDTHEALAVLIEADSSGSVLLDSSQTNTSGIGRLETRLEDNEGVFASKGTPNQSSQGFFTLNRTWALAALTGKALFGIGGIDYDVAPDGLAWMTEARLGSTVQYSSRDMEATFEHRVILPNESITSPSRQVRADHFHLLAGIKAGAFDQGFSKDFDVGGVTKLWTSKDTDAWVLAARIDDSRYYTGVTIRFDPSGILHAFLIHPATDTSAVLYRATSTDGGETWEASEAASGLPDLRPEPVDARFEGDRWLSAAGAQAGSVEIYSSPDALAWSHETTVAPGRMPVLLPLEGRSYLAIYRTPGAFDDAFNNDFDVALWKSRRLFDYEMAWTVEDPVTIQRGKGMAAFRNPQKVLAASHGSGDDAILYSKSMSEGDAYVLGSEG